MNHPTKSLRDSAGTPRSVNAYQVAASVPDPELPMVTVHDLGILRSVQQEGEAVVATITPTYSGCPAMREISADIAQRLHDAGYRDVSVRTQLAPAWSSDWITEAGRRKLAAAGIAPPSPTPHRAARVPLTLTTRTAARCPHCGSSETSVTAQFSSTACKSLHRCTQCAEPFEAVKTV